MNTGLAEAILVKIMEWDMQKINEERPLIQALGTLKYDEYQQFSTGMRFTESLVNWLDQFESVEERNTAYDFIKSQLIFITNEQINHLIEICFNERIDGRLTSKAAEILHIKPYMITKIHNDQVYKELKRKSLFLGLSDGAKIDQLRRSANLDNEQVFSSYHISEEKCLDLLGELKKAFEKESKFNSVFLIDDFTASGLSYIAKDNLKGKIILFIKSIFESKDNKPPILGKLFDTNNLHIHVIFYIATSKSIRYINEGIEKLKARFGYNFNHSVTAVQIIEDQTGHNVKAETAFVNLIKRSKYMDSTIINDHYKKGVHDEPYLGFDECALPIVLNHNTPNNSLPILWFPSDMQIVGLFPRVTRHKE